MAPEVLSLAARFARKGIEIMQLKKQSKIVFIGDSVTDAGRDYHTSAGSFNSLGEGYVVVISAALIALYPAHEIMVINQGMNG